MAFVKILAPLTGGVHDCEVLTGAISAALPFGAHVSGLFVRPDPALAMPFFGEGMSGIVVQEIMDASKEAAAAAARTALAALQSVARTTDLAITEACEKRGAPCVSFREVTGNFTDCVTQAALLSDLVVFSAPRDDERAGIGEAIEAVLLEARRPVLLSAKPIAPGFHEKIAIGWNASVESAQAVSAALPLLKRARNVEILAVGQADAPCAKCGELVEYLSLHGVGAAPREIEAAQRPVAEVLLEAAAASGSGLLVLGGYSRSRWRELFVRSTTSQAISRADIPLFLVH